MSAPEPRAYFVRLDQGRFRATEHTGGGWATHEQHIAPMAGLVLHEIERFAAKDDDKVVSRLSLEILGVIGIEEFDVAVEVVRPGRTIELVEAVVSWAGRAVVRARVWRVQRGDTGAIEGADAVSSVSMPPPGDVPRWDMTGRWPGGFIASLEVRRDAGATPGRARAWVSSDVDLVEGEQVATLPRFLALVDTANGISVRASPTEWMFPNLDLTVHLFREPVPGPTGLDLSVAFGPDGLGLTSAVLHDLQGPVGRLAQTLTVRRLALP